MKRTSYLLLLALVGSPTACSALLSEEVQQCASNDDCDKLGFNGWSCTRDRVCADLEPTGGSAGSSSRAGSSSAGRESGGHSSGGSESGGAGASTGGSAGQAGGGAASGG